MAILEQAILELRKGPRRSTSRAMPLSSSMWGEVTRYALSTEAKRLVLLEREGRPLDIHTGDMTLLAPAEEA